MLINIGFFMEEGMACEKKRAGIAVDHIIDICKIIML